MSNYDDCPETDCIWWAKVGDRINLNNDEIKTVGDGMKSMHVVEFEGCHCPLGNCVRLHIDASDDHFLPRDP